MPQTNNDKKPPLTNYLKYTGIGFQIAGTIAFGVFIGWELDKWLKTPQPYCTIACSLLFIFAGLYLGLRGAAKGD